MVDPNQSTLVTGSSWSSYVVPLIMRMGTCLLGIVAIAGGLLYIKQDSLLYFPEIGGIPRRPANNPRGYRSPDERQVPFESHMIPCSDGVHIHAWLLQAPIAEWKSAPTILFFHGNAGNIGLRIPNALQMLQFLNVNVLMVEYRGYGNSDSVTPSESGLRLDAEAALKFAQSHDSIDSSKLFVFGRSLGGAVAFHLAEYAERNHVPIAGVMVENTFTSISSMVDHLMPFLTPIKPFVLKIGWNSASIVPKLKHSPMLFLTGAKDELVPHTHMRDLHAAATATTGNLVQMHVIPDGTHNESWIQGGPAYWDAIRSFMTAALRQSTGQSRILPPAATIQSSTLDSATNPSLKASGIPIMSSRLMDMAKDAAGFSGSAKDDGGFKKEL